MNLVKYQVTELIILLLLMSAIGKLKSIYTLIKYLCVCAVAEHLVTY